MVFDYSREREKGISLVFSGSAFVVMAMMACPLKEPHVAYSLLFLCPLLLSRKSNAPCLLYQIAPRDSSFSLSGQPAASLSLLAAMKDSLGTSQPFPSMKSLTSKLGWMFCHCGSPNKYKRLDAKLEKKMIELKRSSSGKTSFKSMNSIIMRFPQFKEELKHIRGVFEQYDEDGNGNIDMEELKKCLQKLQVNLKEEEVEDLFHSCDIDQSEGIQFNEFIVLLCLIYLLVEHSSSPLRTSKIGSSELEATFDTIVKAFLFLDKNGAGKLNKKDMIKALNEDSRRERSPAHITTSRFKEMDWDSSGKVSFREFLFSLINWIGIDADEEIPLKGS